MRAALGSFVFFLIAPFTIAAVVPWTITRWRVEPTLLGVPGERIVGGVITLVGAFVLIDCFRRFVTEGRGTPAPVLPTQVLVVTGAYRHVRNPMYFGLVTAVLGQALVFGNLELLVYGLALAAVFHSFVRLYEEPTLRRRYGADYDDFTANVPRWLPRLRPWRGAHPSR